MAGQLRQRPRHDAEHRGRRGAPGRAPVLVRGAVPGARGGRRAAAPGGEGEEDPWLSPRQFRLSPRRRSRPARSRCRRDLRRSRAPAPALRGREHAARQPARRHARRPRRAAKCAAAARSPGGRRAPVARAPAARARRSGPAARPSSDRSRATTRTACPPARAAARCARHWRCRLREGALTVVDKIEIADGKTKSMVQMLAALGVEQRADRHRGARIRCSSGRRATCRRVKVLRVEGANVYDILRHPQLVVTRGGGGRAAREGRRREERVRRRHLAADHREGHAGQRARQSGGLPRAPRREQGRDPHGRRDAVQGEGGEGPHPQPARQDAPRRQARRPPAGLEEGVRDARRGPAHRLLREPCRNAMPIRQYKPTSAGRRGMSVADFTEITKTTPGALAARAAQAHRAGATRSAA